MHSFRILKDSKGFKKLDLNTFVQLPESEVARIVRSAGAKVCVFPINGTRRWFYLEHAAKITSDPITAYLDIAGRRHIALYRMLFDHGIDTLLTPVFGPDLYDRGDTYIERIGIEGLSRLANHPDFLQFYDEYQVRVRFYGDYRKYLNSSPYASTCDDIDAITERMAGHQKHRLFFGVFAHDASESTARLAVEHFQLHGSIPDKEQLVAMYYGEPVGPVDLFIGFDKLSTFDMPLIATGNEDLYFTTAPSPYLSVEQLRHILYDHIYTRKIEEIDYADMGSDDLEWMRLYYAANRSQTIGVGMVRGGIWYPLPAVEWPA
jgi:tuberculosinol/isotuberculosinol synthase